MTGAATEVIVAAAACVLTSAPALETGAEGRLTIADVTSLDCVSPDRRADMGGLVIARLSGAEASLTRQALANLVRRRAPAVTVALGGSERDIIAIRRERQAAQPAASCATALTSITAGEALTQANVVIAPCAASSPLSAAVDYDRYNGMARARVAIAAGAELGRFMAPPPALTADEGDALTLQVRFGAAVIERTVEALQPSTGGAVFVRDGDGAVFSTPILAGRTP